MQIIAYHITSCHILFSLTRNASSISKGFLYNFLMRVAGGRRLKLPSGCLIQQLTARSGWLPAQVAFGLPAQGPPARVAFGLPARVAFGLPWLAYAWLEVAGSGCIRGARGLGLPARVAFGLPWLAYAWLEVAGWGCIRVALACLCVA